MANESGKNERRLPINYWDGLNAVVSKGLAKSQEFIHIENGRSNIVGTIEKREGQNVLGVNAQNGTFESRENYGLSFISTGFNQINGLYRMSASSESNNPGSGDPGAIRLVDVSDSISLEEEWHVPALRSSYKIELLSISESLTITRSGGLTISLSESIPIDDSGYPDVENTTTYLQLSDAITLTDPKMFLMHDSASVYIDNVDEVDVNVYKLDDEERWMRLSHPDANNIAAAEFSSATIDGKTFLVNGRDYNRYIDKDGITVVTSRGDSELSGLGSLYNTPRAKFVDSYKGRIYLANYDWGGIHYGNSILQSSTPLGITSLIQTDTTAATPDEDSTFPTTGLVAYYKLDENSGTAYDTTGSHPLTKGEATFDPTGGKINGALRVSETAEGKYSSDDPGLSSDLTISAWVKLNSLRTSGRVISIGSSGSGTLARLTVGSPAQAIPPDYDPVTGNTYIDASIGTGGTGDSSYQFDFNWSLYAWHHLVATYDSGSNTTTLFIDGSESHNYSQTFTISGTISDNIGIGGSSSADGFDGWVDEVGVWSRVLTDTEISDLYNSGDGLSISGKWKLPVTDTTYIYDSEYANEYEVWRINQKLADIKVSKMDDLNIYVDLSEVKWTDGDFDHAFQSQDQVYVKGTFGGNKVYRFPNNPTLSGSNVKQYNTMKLSGGDESDITVMDNIGNIMLIANKNSLASWNDSVLNNFDLGIGIPSRHGYAKAYGALYFVHYTGVYSTSGQMPSILSSPIQPYIDGATKEGIENAVVGVKGRSVFFCVGDVTLYRSDGSVKRVMKDTCLEYNILQQNWYVHTGVAASTFQSFVSDSAANRLAFTDNVTKDVKVFLEGDTDSGKEIFFRADTQPFSIASNLEDISNPEIVVVESERGSSMEVYVSLDDEEFYQIEGRAEKGFTRLKVNSKDGTDTPPVAHNIALSFRDSSRQRCKLGRAAITFVPAGVSNPP